MSLCIINLFTQQIWINANYIWELWQSGRFSVDNSLKFSNFLTQICCTTICSTKTCNREHELYGPLLWCFCSFLELDSPKSPHAFVVRTLSKMSRFVFYRKKKVIQNWELKVMGSNDMRVNKWWYYFIFCVFILFYFFQAHL